MHANFTRPYFGWTALSLIATASLMSSGCAHIYHLMHYNCISRSIEDEHLTYYHSPKTGRIIPKEHHQVCQVEFPCFGYEPTCWHRWPAECGKCPVQDADTCVSSSCGPHCANETVVQDVVIDPAAQPAPVEAPAAVPADVIEPQAPVEAAPAKVEAKADQAQQAPVLPSFLADEPVDESETAESPSPTNNDWSWMRATPPVRTTLIPEVAQDTATYAPPAETQPPLMGRLPQPNVPVEPSAPPVSAAASQPVADDVVVDEVKADDMGADEVAADSVAVEERESIDLQVDDAAPTQAEIAPADEVGVQELTATPVDSMPSIMPVEEPAPPTAAPAETTHVDSVAPETTTQQAAPSDDLTANDVPTFHIKPSLPPALGRKIAAAPVAVVKVTADDKKGQPAASVRFVAERVGAAEERTTTAGKTLPATSTSLKFR